MRSSYPYTDHCICLFPAVIMLICVHFAIGSEDEVFRYFTAVRKANPAFTKPVELFSHGTLFLFYPMYAFFIIRGLRGKKMDDILFAVSYLVAQLLIAALLCRIVKIGVGRPRPMTGGPFHPFSFGWGYQSFPSGHTGEILGSSLPFIWRYGTPARYLMPFCFGIIVAGVSFSRIYLGMHHPTDIWGGLVFGSLSGYASWALYGFLRDRWQRILPEKLAMRLREK
ncbi:MAG: hypothetical protein DELT_01866 [Desulfovibrio sp.]